MTFKYKYAELFAGIGGFRSALDKLGGECVFASEIDKFATQSYRALYSGAPELHGDITQIDAEDISDHDVLVGGFPCQAFSVAGQRKGFDDTRGTLFFEIARIAKEKRPRLMLLENVKGLLSHDKGQTFDTMCAALNDIGYAIDFRVLNSKYYDVPQNRERIFVVCDRDAAHQPWDIKGASVESKARRRAQEAGVRSFNFDWPDNGEVTTRLRDILETNVDERYYLSEEKTVKLVAQLEAQPPSVTEEIKCYNPRNLDDGSQTRMQDLIYDSGGSVVALTSSCDRLNVLVEPIMVGHVDIKGHDAIKRVYGVEGMSPTLTTMGGGHREPKIVDISGPRYRIRKLVPLECWRLQGFTDEQHALSVAAGLSDSQRYKQAGNAVTVNVIHAIGERLIQRLK